MANLADMPTTYQAILAQLTGHDSVTIGLNTVASWSDDHGIAVSLHGNEIIRLYPTQVAVRHCGYITHTTQDRLNRFLPVKVRATIKNGDMRLLSGDEMCPIQETGWVFVNT